MEKIRSSEADGGSDSQDFVSLLYNEEVQLRVHRRAPLNRCPQSYESNL
jgi:hypothetical protein